MQAPGRGRGRYSSQRRARVVAERPGGERAGRPVQRREQHRRGRPHGGGDGIDRALDVHGPGYTPRSAGPVLRRRPARDRGRAGARTSPGRFRGRTAGRRSATPCGTGRPGPRVGSGTAPGPTGPAPVEETDAPSPCRPPLGAGRRRGARPRGRRGRRRRAAGRGAGRDRPAGRGEPAHPRRGLRQPQPRHQRHEPGRRGAAGRRPRLPAVAGLPGREVRDGAGGDRADRDRRGGAGRRGLRRPVRRGAGRLRRAGQPLRLHGHLPAGRHDPSAAGGAGRARPTTAPARPGSTA